MLFNSFAFLLVFLPAVVALVLATRRLFGARAAQGMVLFASILFSAWLRPANLLYLVSSVLANWYLAHKIRDAAAANRKRWLQLALAANISYLCTFKYASFVLTSLPWTRDIGRTVPEVGFPLGISFYTLTQVMYLVDVYEELIVPGTLFDHATFVSFFPYVIAGPLARAKRMRHQFDNFGGQHGERAGFLARGIFQFSLGLFKKAVIADTFAQIANFGFDQVQHRSSPEVFLFALTYAMQLYFDFSGYSDMAIGSAKMLGIEIPRNFDAPFRSKSIIDFWERWHISLSSFINTYLYTPILRSFNRVSLAKSMTATVIAMTIAGIWHGPSRTFVAFGILHGVALAVNSFWRKRVRVALPASFCWLITFLFVCFTFLFFRAPTLALATVMLKELCFAPNGFGLSHVVLMHANFSLPIFGPPILLGLVLAFAGKSSEQLAREFTPTWRSALVSGLALVSSAVFMNSQLTPAFIYFKF